MGNPIRENPLAALRIGAQDNRRDRRLLGVELHLLVAATRKTRNPLMLPIILFALETGMRRGEILAMNWSDVDLKRHSVTIPEAKNGYARTIPLTEKACSLLDGFSVRTGSIFPITPTALKLSWTRLTKRAGLDNLHFHDLRHEAISRFFEVGLTIPEVASISGHRDMRMLFRYAHADPSRVLSRLEGKN